MPQPPLSRLDLPFRIVAEGLAAPEGPVVLPDGDLLVCEMAAGQVTRVKQDGRKSVVARVDGTPNGAAIGPDGALYICNRGRTFWADTPDGGRVPTAGPDQHGGGSIERIDLISGRVERLYEACDGRALAGPNDLVMDGKGGFWFTDFGHVRARDRDRTGVFHALCDGSGIREVIFPLDAPNGIGLSPDGHSLYVAESYTQALWRFDIGADGRSIRPAPPPSMNGGHFHGRPGGPAGFDSLKVDAAGHVVVAAPFGMCLFDFAPDGSVTQIPVPDFAPTNIAFGGPDMRTAFVTLAVSGRVIALEWPRPGLRLAYQTS